MANKFSNIKERALHIAELKGISKELFFQRIDMTYGSFKGSAKNRPLNSDAIEKILTFYPDINPSWFVLGQGSILKESAPETAVQKSESSELLKRVEELAVENAMLKAKLADCEARLNENK